MKSRYFINHTEPKSRPRPPAPQPGYAKPRAFWVEDDTYDEPIRQDTPQVCDHEAIDTGLLDANGDSIWRAPNPIGFLWEMD